MYKAKRMLVFSLLVFLLFASFSRPSIAMEDSSSNLTRGECIQILQDSGLTVDNSAIIGISEVKLADESVINAICVEHKNPEGGDRSILLLLDQDNNPINVSRSLSYSSKIKNGSISSVYISAYYYYATTTYLGTYYKLYRPYRLTSTSSVSQNIYVDYCTIGVGFNLNGEGLGTYQNHHVTNSAYPAAVGQQYSTTNTSSRYIADSNIDGGLHLTHRVFVTINGSSVGSFAVTSDSN